MKTNLEHIVGTFDLLRKHTNFTDGQSYDFYRALNRRYLAKHFDELKALYHSPCTDRDNIEAFYDREAKAVYRVTYNWVKGKYIQK